MEESGKGDAWPLREVAASEKNAVLDGFGWTNFTRTLYYESGARAPKSHLNARSHRLGASALQSESMEHLVIGAAQSAHNLEYARSWERATAERPHLRDWVSLSNATIEPVVQPGVPLLLRCAEPTGAELRALALFGHGAASSSAPSAGAELEIAATQAKAAFAGLCRTLVQLTATPGLRGPLRFAVAPQEIRLLLDREARTREISEDGMVTPTRWTLQGSVEQRYEELRERLRRTSGGRVLLQLPQTLGPSPLIMLSQTGRGLRARSNCRLLPTGGVLTSPRIIDDDAELRPLISWCLAQGATAEEEWPAAEAAGQPYALSLLVTPQRVVLGMVVAADPFVSRKEPLAGAPDFSALRRQLPSALLERLETVLPTMVLRHHCAALVVEVALSRRLTDFALLDTDPFAALPPTLRDATGWSSTDHLVRAVRQAAAEAD